MSKKIAFLVVLVVTICIMIVIKPIDEAQASDRILSDSLASTTFENAQTRVSGDLLTDTSYYDVYQKWQSDNVAVPNKEYRINATDFSGGNVIAAQNSMGYGKQIVSLDADGNHQLTFDLNVDTSGLYELHMDYLIDSKTRLNPTFTLLVNNKLQYNEMGNLNIPIEWVVVPNEEGFTHDRYGNELSPKSEVSSHWDTKGIADPGYYYLEPLKMFLESGSNSISITLNNGIVNFGDIVFKNTENNIISYAEYKNIHGNYEDLHLNKPITVEAEDIALKARQSIRTRYERNPKVTPYEYKTNVLNVVDGASFSEPGDYLTYSFSVEEAGYYDIVVKYKQDTNMNLPSFRTITIDGKVPFEEFLNYPFKYTRTWKNETLRNKDGENLRVYLSKGDHELTLTVSNHGIRDIYQDFITILEKIEDISYNLSVITGGVTDTNRDWKLDQYYPTLKNELVEIADDIKNTREQLEQYLDNSSSIISEINSAERLVRNFTNSNKALNEIAYKGYNFDSGDSSAYGRINTALPYLLQSPLHLDKIHINNGGSIPKANANIFVSFGATVQAFFYSFFDDRYSQNFSKDDQTLNIWVNKSRLYVEMMQRMIDENFTPQTGIKVNLSLLPDENKILLANAAGNTPDGAISVSHSRPFELGIRGILEDLSDYDGFYELSDEYNINSFVPYIYGDNIFAIPETQDVKMLFYRKDVLRQLDLDVPDTWNDVVNMLPSLQSVNKSFYNPIGGISAHKTLGDTLPFFYQFGGELYGEDATDLVYNQAGGFEGFEFMTDLFTIYNVPTQTANFYQHFRTGKLPIGVGGINEYIQLKYAAPELAGQWDVAVIPGVYHEDSGEVERWDPTFGSSSIIFSNSEKKDLTWDLIKWWHSKETQADFSFEIQAKLGNKFLYMSANVDAFKQSAWPSDSKDVVLDQWEWIRSTGKVPGDYMVERQISFAWNDVVMDGALPRVAIDQTNKPILNEIERKLEEFGYFSNNEQVKDYKVPTIYNINDWFPNHS